MSRHVVVISLLSIAIAAAALPATNAEPLVELALGTPLSADFNADDGGWTANPPAPPHRPVALSSWEWGVPTSGPGVAASGSKVWATNLAGTYLARDCSAILSPPITIPAGATASASFSQWRHMDESSFSTGFANDAGLLFVTSDGGMTLQRVDPAGGYDSKRIGSTSRTCLDGQVLGQLGLSGPAGTTPPAPTYSTVATDLSAFAGQTVQLAIAFSGDCCTHRAGWYVDDFAVTIDGVTTVEDFEASDGGFSVVGTLAPLVPLGFSWDTPTVGPNPSSATGMWATNPHGDHGHKECAWVESPTFLLGDVDDLGLGTVRASLSWSQWFRGNSLYAAGIVQVGVHDGDAVEYVTLTPVGGYNGEVDGTYADQMTACLGVAVDQPAFESSIDAVNGPLRPYQADLSAFVGDEVSIRFFFTSAWSNLNPTLNEGWYVDDVNVDLTLAVDGGVDPEAILDGLAGSGENPPAPLWTSGGLDSSWAYGVATYGPSGETVFGTNLTGRHNDPECSWAETPAVPGAALLADPTLTFEHFYDIYSGSTVGAAWSGVALFASVDDGATWTYVDTPEYDLEARYSDTRACMASLDPALPTSGTVYAKVFSGNHSGWETANVDLSAYSDAPSLKVRFVFSSGIGILRDGYNLRSASIGGVPIL